MFYSADKELRRLKRRISEEMPKNLIVSPDMDVSLSSLDASPLRVSRNFRAEYPDFTDLSLRDIRALADSIDTDAVAPDSKKARFECLVKVIPDDQAMISAIPRRKSVVSTWEDLVGELPEMKDILRDQQAKLESSRIHIEFARPSKLSTVPEPNVSNPTISNIISSQNIPSFPTNPPQEKAEEPGGGLLAGIDDMFGSSKKSKLKSRRGR